METFKDLYRRAAERKGGEIALTQLTSKPLTNDELSLVTDNEVLAEFTRKIFQSGFVWAVVNKKWDGFEEVFWNFDINKLILMPDDMLERKAADTKIIRNYTKVKTVRDNAQWLKELSDEFGSIGQWLANWPSDDITGLWLYLKKHGSRLGGNTGPYALRQLGKDTFILSRDVEAYFRANKLIEGGLTSKRNLKIIQDSFNQWQNESGYSLQEISQIVAYSVGDNRVGFNAAS
ncbi:MAG: DNA-3-methyladenine glycosylase I [Moritella sp.]|uniref:DNA-3-methyladenine glycosylase I n=1 Tax=Moritella sp. TaxID=78556 RepID=UPI0029AB128B|nr:DNA-3-methyladenine glycosylase I [Moritella sp.]MDX2319864.1 DNA-3-methyladenine glycosylase I [Moritella sp.]